MKVLILLNAKVSIKHMKTYVKTSAKALGLTNTLKASGGVEEVEEGEGESEVNLIFCININFIVY